MLEIMKWLCQTKSIEAAVPLTSIALQEQSSVTTMAGERVELSF